jgi:hypothetical protein
MMKRGRELNVLGRPGALSASAGLALALALGMAACQDVVNGAKNVPGGMTSYTIALGNVVNGSTYTAAVFEGTEEVGAGSAKAAKGSAGITLTPSEGMPPFSEKTYRVRITSGANIREDTSVSFVTGGNTRLDWKTMTVIAPEPVVEPNGKIYTDGDVTLTLTAITKKTAASKAEGVPADADGSVPAFSLSAPASGDTFNYSLAVKDEEVSKGTVAIAASKWTFTPDSGEEKTATASGGSVNLADLVALFTADPAPETPAPQTPAPDPVAEVPLDEPSLISLADGDGNPLDASHPYSFPSGTLGYSSVETLTVRVTNSGDAPTGTLKVALGSGTAAFSVLSASLGSIAPDGFAAFTVEPNFALGVKTHTGSVVVSGGGGTGALISARFDIEFTVKAAAAPETPTSPNEPSAPVETEAPAVRKLFEDGKDTETVSLSNLSGNTVYILKVNRGDKTASASSTGSVSASSTDTLGVDTLGVNTLGVPNGISANMLDTPEASGVEASETPPPEGSYVSGRFVTDDGETITRYERPRESIRDRIQRRTGGVGILKSVTAPLQYALNETKTFWGLNAAQQFIQVPATLRATGTHCNVWVANNNYTDDVGKAEDGKINQTQAEQVSDKFDQIYAVETALFGYEFGGGLSASDPDYGGADRDPKIQILVYDMYEAFYLGQRSGVLGYFYNKDEYMQADLSSKEKSNEAEIFYIDAHFTDIAPNAIYSTLAHEFQHMINYNVKELKNDKDTGTWYNEMLSMLAEDVIAPLIGIATNNSGHPIMGRIPDFLGHYNTAAPTVWQSGNSVYYSYANSYAFGAYLVRNFGGAALIQALMRNDAVDEASVTAALNSAANPLRPQVASFDEALRRYGEALVFNQAAATRPEGVLSFNNTVTDTVNGNDYTFSGFDIWNMANTYNSTKGPRVYDAGSTASMPAGTMQLQTKSAWKNVTGGFTLTVNKPASSDVEVYVMVK